ncbi:hypothetical protein [Catalinimonas alkaloidigena]|nr:hypothetical protein [Catalinimonas alkaloidigena]
MNTLRLRTLAFFLTLFTMSQLGYADPPKDEVKINIDPQRGIRSIEYGDTEFLNNGQFKVLGASLFDAATGKTDSPEVKSFEKKIDVAKNQVSYVYPWATYTCTYTPKGNELALEVSVKNTSNLTLQSHTLNIMALRLPTPPEEYKGNNVMLASNKGGLSIKPLTFQGGKIVLTNNDVKEDLLIGFPWANNRAKNTVFPLWILTGKHPWLPTSLPYIDRPIAPGKTDTYHLSLRFGGEKDDPDQLASDVYETFSKTYPMQLNWEDRRPIGTLFLATANQKYPTNPRGWWNDKKINVTTPEGRAEFQKRVLAYADQSIKILKDMNAQGMITWDIEGEESWHPNTYVGDPRLVKELAPEMEEVADAYFKKFTDAGFKVGVCLRPQRLDLNAFRKGKPAQRELKTTDQLIDTKAVADLLIDKISYAKDRWGCTLFYVDSNGDPNNPYDVEIFRRVLEAHPDVLVIPEHETLLYYAYTAPLISLQHAGQTSTPMNVRRIYPQAFTVNLSSTNKELESKRAALVNAVDNGDILTFNAWFTGPANEKIKNIYRTVSRSSKGVKRRVEE